MPPHRLLSLALAGVLVSSVLQAQEPAPSVRIVDRVDESRLATLAGNTHPLARAEFDRGRVSPDLAMGGLVLVLKRSPAQQQAFDKFVASQQDPNSPNYHHWLEPGEVGERFGPSESDIAVIENWLRGRGLTVGELSPDRMTIHFGGSAEQVSAAFHTEIHNLNVNGVAHIANMTDPKIPEALAPVVAGPKALHNFRPHPLHRLGSKVVFNREKGGWVRLPAETPEEKRSISVMPRPEFGVNDPNNGLVEDVTPYDFATIYNVAPLWSKGIDGTGQTIAIAGTSQINPSDLTTFRSQFGLPTIKSFKQVVANGIDPGQCGVNPSQPSYCGLGDQVENSLDVEWSSAVAKGASVVLVVSGEDATGTIDTVYESSYYVVKNRTAPVLNVSYGLCELGEGAAGNQTYNNLWQTASSEGIAAFVASGDSGSAACDQGFDANGVPYLAEYGLSVSGIASTPYDTAVGGTDLNWCDPIKSSDSCKSEAGTYWSTSNTSAKANAKGYVPEIPWDSTCVSTVGIEYAGYWDDQLYKNGFSGTPSTPQDAEESCSFYYDWAGTIAQAGGPDLSFIVDTVGAGGGLSNCIDGDGQHTSSCKKGYPAPSWQSGVTGASHTTRAIPDVSFFASSGFLGSAYLICVSVNGACTYSATAENSAQEVGGTSAASPAMAGIMALINQKAGGPWGNPNAELYALAKKQDYASCSAESVKTSSSCYFNDVDTQSNAQPCDHSSNSPDCAHVHSDSVGILKGYSAGRGFDMATGLGSLNVGNVVNAWPAVPIPAVTLSAATLKFPSTVRGKASTDLALTLKSSGSTAVSLSGTGKGISLSGANATSFSQTNDCGTSLSAGASCTVKIVFKPQLVGALSATLSVADNASGSPQTVSLTGTSTGALIAATPSTVTFTGTRVGKKSYPQVMTLTNESTSPMTVSLSITGTNAAAFLETNTCGTSWASGTTCKVSVSFAPTNLIGDLSASLRAGFSGSGSPAKFAIQGSAAGPVVGISRTHLTFSATAVGVAAATQSFTVANKGNVLLGKPGGGSIFSLTGTGRSSFSQTNTCGATLAAGSSCTVTVTFKPRSTGTLSAAVTLTDNAYPSTQSVLLTGTGK